jgi:TPR repeat protein
MKKLLIAVGLMVVLAAGLFAQAGNFRKAKEYHDAAANRMARYGDTDAEVLKLYQQAIDEYKKCITVNNRDTGEAYNYLGRILFTGPRSLRNYPEAVQYLNEAVKIYERERKPGVFIPHCYNEIGTALYRLGDYYGTFTNWSKSSALSPQFAGDEAQIYWLGLGVEQDLAKAMELYRKAALAGRDLWENIYALDYQIKEYNKGNFDNEGMYLYLDYINAMSMGDPRDVWMSILKISADLGWPPAQLAYWIYCRDSNEAAKGMPYLQKAVAANYTPALFHMGYVYQAGLNNTRVDYQEAKKWYEKAAVEGLPVAQNNLGGLYFQNYITSDKGVSNKEMANYWWNIAADQGFALAIQNKPLVANYRPPVSKIEATLTILNSVLSIINTSTRNYRSLNRSGIQGYVPPGGGGQGTAQNNPSTASSSSPSSPSSGGIGTIRTQCKNCNGGNCMRCGGVYQKTCTTCHGTGAGNGLYGLCTTCKGMKYTQCDAYGCNRGKCTFCKGTGWLNL